MKRRILLTAIHRSPYLGGLEQAFLHLLDGIPGEEFEIAVALMPGMDDSIFGRAIQTRHIPIVFLDDVLLKSDVVGMSRMISVIRRAKPEIIHVHLTHPLANPFLQIAAWLARVPVLIATEQTNVLIKQKQFGRRRKQFTGKITEVEVAVSEASRRGLIEHYGLEPRKILVIPNAVDARRIAGGGAVDIRTLRAELGVGQDDFLIGTVAALRDQKGHSFLLQAIPAVLRELPRARLLLIGDGDLRPELERHVHELAIAERVIFAGWRNDVAAALHALDLFVLPSLWEGMPLAVLEAMAAARPVVATAVDGTAEIIQNEVDGLLVPPANPPALAHAILRIASSPDLSMRLAKAGREKALSSYDATVMANRYVDLYRSQLGKKGI